MKNQSQQSPNLVEPGISAYIGNALQKCHNSRVVIYYWILNIGVVVFLACIAAFYVFFAYRKKLSPVEIREKMLQDHENVLQQIRVYRQEQDKIHQFTDLPSMIIKQRDDPQRQQPDPIREVLMPL
jgi:hypothetical protein